MSRIHIDKIEATGQKGISSIEFGENLTIIMGKSETGKTTVYKCIDYLFGSDADEKHRPFLLSTGYDTIVGYFTTDLGKIKLSRKIDTKKIYIETDITGIDISKPYGIDPSKADWIGLLYDRILGVPEGFKIPWSQDGKMKKFSWRSIKRTFMVYEKDIETEDSIMLPRQNTNQTAYLSELLYILFKTDFTNFDAEEGQKIKRVRKAAVQKYINAKKEIMGDKLKKLKEDYVEKYNDVDFSILIHNLEEKLKEIKESLDHAILEDQVLSKSNMELQRKAQELNITLSKFHTLETKYTADIKRLCFIVDNEKIVKSKSKTSQCPLCHTEVVVKDNGTYIEASKGELNKTIEKLNDLNETKIEVTNELQELNASIKLLQEKRNEITKLMNNDLLPKQKSIEEQLQTYQEIIEYKKALSLFEELDVQYDEDYKNYEKIEATIKYRPRELFPEGFSDEIAGYYKEILKETNFQPINKVEFDLQAFDSIVNDNPKSNRSKGYASIFNSILILSFREYINKHAQINPHFYLLDSPLHGLMTQTQDDTFNEENNNEDDIRKGFFNYIFKQHGSDQIIVIENTDNHELPLSESYDESKIKIYTFTKDPTKGRYGFLSDVFQN